MPTNVTGSANPVPAEMTGGAEDKEAKWDGTSSSGLSRQPLLRPNEGQESPPVRGTATSSLGATDEEGFIIRLTTPQGDRRMWPASSGSGDKTDSHDAQANDGGLKGEEGSAPPSVKASV